MKERGYAGIDCFRLLAAIFVIAIHTSPLGSIHETVDFILTRILARTAVPFFFMATGFFLFSQQKRISFSYRSFVQKIGVIYAISILLYVPLNIYTGYFGQERLGIRILRDIIFDGTFYHLWYLPAVILGVGIVVSLRKHCRWSSAFMITGLLYVIGIFGDSYYDIGRNIPYMKQLYEFLFYVFDYTRNGIFFAPIYVLLGGWISVQRRRSSFRQTWMAFLLSLLFLIVEGLLLQHFSDPRHDSMYISLVPCMYYLFQLLLFVKGGRHRSLGDISLMIYIIHPWNIVLTRGLGKRIGAEGLLIENSVMHFIVVTGLSIMMAILFTHIKNKRKKEPFSKGRAWVEVNLSNLKNNLKEINSILQPGCEVMAVVKADAYGHGDIEVATELQRAGVGAFAVASIEEGVRLRKKGIKGSILILGYTHPEEVLRLKKYDLTQTVLDYHYGKILHESGKTIKVHIKIDTGMYRLGEPYDHIHEIKKMFQFQNLVIEGMYTHLCVADSLQKEDIAFTKEQVKRFSQLVKVLQTEGYSIPKTHIQSSYGVLNYPELRCSYARVGIALYGIQSSHRDQTKLRINLAPVLSVKARIAVVKELEPQQTMGYGRQFVADKHMKIATVTIGYADGIPRNLTGSSIIIKGKKASVIGRICMDQLSVDVTEISQVEPGDVVTIIGEEDGEKITGEQVAGQAGTITNELFSRLGSRLERIYI